MAWEKASPAMMDLLAEALADYDCTSRKMFGSVAYFVHGIMFAGVLGSHIMLRMGPEDREIAFSTYGESVAVEPLGRRMKEYVAVPHEMSEHKDELDAWLGRSYTFVAALPPKQTT